MDDSELAAFGQEILRTQLRAALQACIEDPSPENKAALLALAEPGAMPARENIASESVDVHRPSESSVPSVPSVLAGAKTAIPAVADAAKTRFPRFRKRLTKEHKPVPIPWPSIAAPFNGGLWPGVHILAGGTGAGKTALALQWALHAAQQGVPALYVGLEMTEEDIVARLASLLCNVEPGRILAGAYHPRPLQAAEFDEIEEVTCQQLAALPAFRYRVASAHAWDYELLAEDAEALRRETEYTGGATLLVLDFLQVVASPPGAREDLRERISKAAYKARAAAGTSSVACLMVSSAARERVKWLQKWADGWPRYSVEVSKPKKGEEEGETVDCTDFIGIGKESGDIEYAAETLTILAPINAVDMMDPDVDTGGDTRVRIAWPKVRYGPRGATSTLIFNGYRWRDDPRGQAFERASAPRVTFQPAPTKPKTSRLSAAVMRAGGAGLAARGRTEPDDDRQIDLATAALGVAAESEPRPKRGRR